MASIGNNPLPRPPFDPEIEVLMGSMPFNPAAPTPETVHTIRSYLEDMLKQAVANINADPALVHEERAIAGPDGNDIQLSIVSPKARDASSALAPGILHVHGGGMFAGNRFLGMSPGVCDWGVKQAGAVAVSVEYRLAPEHPHPAPVDDCYAALQWLAAHAAELGVDPARLVIVGGSAGAGIAAGVALMARDRGGPGLLAQVLLTPMLDDRNTSVSSRQYAEGVTWDRRQNLLGWKCLLGEKAGGDDVSIYAAPARATDLSGLPPAFIDAGSAEPFRDEAVAYASKLWECGVQAELHVWPGGSHGFSSYWPTIGISQDSVATRAGWVRRTLEKAQSGSA